MSGLGVLSWHRTRFRAQDRQVDYRGRLAPSPTGALHLGSAAAFVMAAGCAQAAQGQLVLRVEDLDRDRVRADATKAMIDDLHWLGLSWHEGPDVGGPSAPYLQSERTALYQAALDYLRQQELVYYCDCSRAEVRRAASAPHVGEEGPIYPGTCRAMGLRPRAFKRDPALRLKVPTGCQLSFVDRIAGRMEQDVGAEVGDFVVQRGDGTFAYQLAVVVDDIAMGITEVVRGRDLLFSTPRQLLLMQMLGGRPPTYCHFPLVVDQDGQKLSKRAAGVPIEDQRRKGRPPETLVAAILAAYGQRRTSISELQFEPEQVNRSWVSVDELL